MLAAWLKNRFTGNVIVQEKVDHALNVALALAGKDDAVLVTGSFYTVSEARAVYQDLIQHRTE